MRVRLSDNKRTHTCTYEPIYTRKCLHTHTRKHTHVQVCERAHTGIHTHTRTHKYKNTSTHVQTHAHTHASTHTHIHTHAHTHTYIQKNTHPHPHPHPHTYTRIDTHAHTLTHTHAHTHTRTRTRTRTRTHTHTHTHIYAHTGTYTQTHTHTHTLTQHTHTHTFTQHTHMHAHTLALCTLAQLAHTHRNLSGICNDAINVSAPAEVLDWLAFRRNDTERRKARHLVPAWRTVRPKRDAEQACIHQHLKTTYRSQMSLWARTVQSIFAKCTSTPSAFTFSAASSQMGPIFLQCPHHGA